MLAVLAVSYTDGKDKKGRWQAIAEQEMPRLQRKKEMKMGHISHTKLSSFSSFPKAEATAEGRSGQANEPKPR